MVEDDPLYTEALRKILIPADCEVEVVGSGEDALIALQRDSFALAVVDLTLPAMDGRTLLRMMSRDPNWSSIPAIIVSAASPVLPDNAVAFLQKPIRSEELLALVLRHLPQRPSAP
ncbi:MAG TPA: response regulator [Planctomycetota bacterium]|nr:response regulator [Planctomycetota bacterium]